MPPASGSTLADLLVERLVNGAELGGSIVMSPVGRMIHPGNAADWVTYEERFPYRDAGQRARLTRSRRI